MISAVLSVDGCTHLKYNCTFAAETRDDVVAPSTLALLRTQQQQADSGIENGGKFDVDVSGSVTLSARHLRRLGVARGVLLM